VGRRSDLSLTLSRQTVSGLHAEIVSRDDTLYLRDLDSTNGTYLNGERIVGERPLKGGELIQFADLPFRFARESASAESQTMCADLCDDALAAVQFDTLLTERAVVPYYQPIVELSTGDTIAFEALARSRLVGLETPAAMFRAASQFELEVELSRLMSSRGIEESAKFAQRPHLFVNTHPAELEREDFVDTLAEWSAQAPLQMLTLEIHEAAVTDLAKMSEIRRAAEDLDMRIAFDDFGAGQARIAELAEIRPDYLKFDIKMIRNIDTAGKERRSLVGSLVHIVREIGVLPLAEGVETIAEAEACTALGFVLAQGFHFGKPAPVSDYV
jgi:EAL domain-containing protein (putative c-di-GMP-specific phosphodiesterase class I)